MSRYQQLIEEIFLRNYEKGATVVAFDRDELVDCAKALKMKLPKNLGDVIYSFRYRNPLPESVVATATEEREWIIGGAGRGRYEFRQVKINRIVPSEQLIAIKIPDATPEIVLAHALSDEQALLAKVRYNRLIDVFLGVAAYSLQNHLRTTAKGVGQIEIDEIYVAIDRHGRQFVLPVQAKGGTDQLGVVQTAQDIACCEEKYPNLICRAISTQFIDNDLIAMFELAIQDDFVKVVQEKHYKLVPGADISDKDLKLYNKTAVD